MNPFLKFLLAAPVALALLIALIASFVITRARRLARRGQLLWAGTAPANFPPESFLPIGQVITGNKLGNTGAFATTIMFTAPTDGLYLIGWAVRIRVTDAAGSITATVTPPNSVAIPGVQAAPATPSDGKGPAAPYWMNAGQTVTMAVAVSGLTGTTFDCYVSAIRLF